MFLSSITVLWVLTCGHNYLDHRLDVYIYDYLLKRNLHASAKAFQAEGKVSTDPVGKNMVIMLKWRDLLHIASSYPNWFFFFFCLDCTFIPAIDAPGGFLFEWWSVFWDIFIARTNEKHSEAAASYIEVIIWFLRVLICISIYVCGCTFYFCFWEIRGRNCCIFYLVKTECCTLLGELSWRVIKEWTSWDSWIFDTIMEI